MKPCSQCGKRKPLVEFNKRRESKDGLTPSCRECIKERRTHLRKGGGVSEVAPELTADQKKVVYTNVIARMRNMGLTSDFTTREMLERVNAL